MSGSTEQDLQRAAELTRLGRHREALDALDRVLALEPTNARALRLRSTCLALLGEHEASIVAARAGLAADPESGHGYWTLSLALDLAGRAAEAVEAAAVAVRLKPYSATMHVRLAESLLDINPPAAVGPAERARALEPDSAVVHLACGTVYEANRRNDDARRSYLLALEVDPQNSVAHLRIAGLDKKANKWEAALGGFSRVITLNPRSTAARRQIEALIITRLSVPLLASFAGAVAASLKSAGGDGIVRRVVAAVVLGVIAGISFLTIRGLHRAAGSFLWHFLRTDKVAIITLSLTSIYVVYFIVATQTTLIPLTGDAFKVCAVLFLRFLANVLSSRVARRGLKSGAPTRKYRLL